MRIINTRTCCQIRTRTYDGDAQRPTSRWRRTGKIVSWIVPSATLALLPKCPICVAAYVALLTGIGISVPTATYLRVVLAVFCVVSLVFLVARHMRRLIFPANRFQEQQS
jgi:hypothetical protein